MSFENYFPLWNDLNTAQKKLISDNLITQHVKKGTSLLEAKTWSFANRYVSYRFQTGIVRRSDIG